MILAAVIGLAGAGRAVHGDIRVVEIEQGGRDVGGGVAGVRQRRTAARAGAAAQQDVDDRGVGQRG